MENATGSLNSSAIDLAGELRPRDLIGESSLNAATRRSSLHSDETLSDVSDHKLRNSSSNRNLSTLDLVSGKKSEGLNDSGSSGSDTRSPQLTDSKNKNKATSHNLQTNKDGLTGIAPEDALVGHNRPLTRGNRAKPGTGGTNLPDLVGVVDDVKMPKTIDPRKKEDKGQIKVDIRNIGDTKASGSLTVNIYASPDLTLNASDQLLDTVNRGNVQIQDGNRRKFTFDFTNPAGVAPGAYYLIVDIDPGKTITESNEINNAAYRRVSASGTDVVVDWNATILNAIVATKTSPPVASRNMAILHTAIYDAVTTNPRQLLSREAAVAAAAHRVLLNFYPTEAAVLKEQLDMSLAEVEDGQAKTRGIALGRAVADESLAKRSTDGSNAPSAYTPSPVPGHWQPTPSGFAPALLPHWGNITPFTLQSGSQFRSAGPPALSSAEYAADVNQVQAVGSQNSTSRTADQTETALFWADGAGTFTPPGHWNLITEQLAVARRNTLAQNARLFALLNCAEADAGIAAWDAKYIYDLWRPVTAIRSAALDGNDATIADPFWTSLITTPPFPEYVSGHSTFSGAASTILASVFGDNTSFATTSIGLPGVVRTFTSFTQAADEAGMSRIYGGIHFGTGNIHGLTMGRSIGQHTFNNSPFGVQEGPLAGQQRRSRRAAGISARSGGRETLTYSDRFSNI